MAKSKTKTKDIATYSIKDVEKSFNAIKAIRKNKSLSRHTGELPSEKLISLWENWAGQGTITNFWGQKQMAILKSTIDQVDAPPYNWNEEGWELFKEITRPATEAYLAAWELLKELLHKWLKANEIPIPKEELADKAQRDALKAEMREAHAAGDDKKVAKLSMQLLDLDKE
jgi:hypothetical protein